MGVVNNEIKINALEAGGGGTDPELVSRVEHLEQLHEEEFSWPENGNVEIGELSDGSSVIRRYIKVTGVNIAPNATYDMAYDFIQNFSPNNCISIRGTWVAIPPSAAPNCGAIDSTASLTWGSGKLTFTNKTGKYVTGLNIVLEFFLTN